MSDDTQAARDLAPVQYASKLKSQIPMVSGMAMPESWQQVVEFSQYMAKGGIAIPKHLRNEPGACMSVIQRSMAWEMNPWAVATKTYSVNDVLAYEAQLIAAVVKKCAPVREKVWNPVYSGEGPTRQCTITVHHAETGEKITYISPVIGKTFSAGTKEPAPDYEGIWPKNSPLWRFEPDQQLFYYSIRAMARRFFPDILLGVYDREEAYAMRDVTPANENGPVNFLNDDAHDSAPSKPVVTIGKDNTVVAMDLSAGAAETAYEDGAMPPVTMDNVPLKKEGVPITAGDLKTGESYTFDPETGEIDDTPAEPVDPAIIKANLLRQIASEDDKIKLESWQSLQHEAINGLPPNMGKEVRDALRARHEALEPF